MAPTFPFNFMLIFSFLSALLITGFILRAKIGFIQKYLFPSSLIGGIIGFIIVNALKMDTKIFETFAYHFFNLSFISIGLTPTPPEEKLEKHESRDSFLGALWMALFEGAIFPLQAAVGGIFVLIFVILGMKLHPAFGFLLPLGFEEGPGQALSFGKVWEKLGFENAAMVGITYAILGFVVAIVVGIPLVNWGLRKKLKSTDEHKLPEEFIKGFYPPDRTENITLRQTTHPANIESLAFQLGMVGLAYGITYYITYWIAALIGGNMGKLAWGFFFLFGMVIAMGIRSILTLFKVDYLLSVPLQRRITGFSVDYLIVATGAAIQLEIIGHYIVPILIISTFGAIVTLWLAVYLGRRLHSYNIERMAAIFGTVTGTVSTGILLLRIVDPEFKTPVIKEIGFMNVFAVPIIFVLTMMVNVLPFKYHLGTLTVTLIFLGVTVTVIALMKIIGLIKEPKF